MTGVFMKVFDGVKNLPYFLSKSVMTIGKFDGIHLGHKQLIQELTSHAKKQQIPSVVMTFSPHPRVILYPHLNEDSFYLILDRSDQEDILQKMGVDYLIIEPFSKAFSQISPDVFFQQWIKKPFSPQKLIVGHDFTFGSDRSGTIEMLKTMTRQNDMQLQVIPPVKVNGQVVGSSYIRKILSKGEVAEVIKYLGRPYHLKGRIQYNSISYQWVFYSEGHIPFTGVFQAKVCFEKKTMLAAIVTIDAQKHISIQLDALEENQWEQRQTDLAKNQKTRIFFHKRLSGL